VSARTTFVRVHSTCKSLRNNKSRTGWVWFEACPIEGHETKDQICRRKLCSRQQNICLRQARLSSRPTEFCSGRTELCPGRRKLCPSRTKSCPGRTKLCPGRTKSCPGRTKLCPGRTKLCPRRTKSCPGRTKLCPGRTKLCPRRTKSCPGRTKLCPSPTQSCPGRTRSYAGRTEFLFISNKICRPDHFNHKRKEVTCHETWVQNSDCEEAPILFSIHRRLAFGKMRLLMTKSFPRRSAPGASPHHGIRLKRLHS
jgi:hypothetical protein